MSDHGVSSKVVRSKPAGLAAGLAEYWNLHTPFRERNHGDASRWPRRAASAVGYLLFNYALRFVEASRASVFTNLTPVVGIAGAYLLLGERFSTGQVIAAIVVGAGVWLANSGRRCAGATCPPTA